MKATIAILVAPYTIDFVEEDLPEVGDDDMLIKMDAVGLCHSDLPGYVGSSIVQQSKYGYSEPGSVSYPVQIGHEAIATVMETGKNVSKFRQGDHISGRLRQCFRTHMVIRQADQLSTTTMLFKLPSMQQDYLCCLAEPLECVVNIARIAAPEFQSNVAVVGCGVMGLLTMAALSTSGARRLAAIDLLDNKLEMAKSMGATDIINPKSVDSMSEWAYSLTEGRFFDVVIEITGSIHGLDTAMQIVKYTHNDGHTVNQYVGNGRVLIPSVYSREEVFPARLGLNIMVRSPIIQAVHPVYSIDPMYNEVLGIEAFLGGILPMEKMITHRVAFDQLTTGLNWLIKPPDDYIKGIVVFD